MSLPSFSASMEEPSHRVGPFDVTSGIDALTLRLENQGELTLRFGILCVFLMLVILSLGLLAIVPVAAPPYHAAHRMRTADPTDIFNPSQNPFGTVWLISLGALIVGVPLYVARTYRSGLAFSFHRADDTFTRNGRLITRLHRIEYVILRETRDPDNRYLYKLLLSYNDGQQMTLHASYDEREIMNLANEISVFIGVKVVWN